MTTLHTYTRNLGINKGKRRLWLEGAVLTDHNINHGMRWNIISNGDNHIIVEIAENGKRKIAGKPARPIIDIAGKTITDAFADTIERVKIERISGGIIITGIK